MSEVETRQPALPHLSLTAIGLPSSDVEPRKRGPYSNARGLPYQKMVRAETVNMQQRLQITLIFSSWTVDIGTGHYNFRPLPKVGWVS